MSFSAVEKRVRLAMVLFVAALVLTVGLSLALYSQARGELAAQRELQLRLEAALLASLLPAPDAAITDESLKNRLDQIKLSAAAAVFAKSGHLIASASTLERSPDWDEVGAGVRAVFESGNGSSPPPARARVRKSGGYDVVEIQTSAGSVLALARPIVAASTAVVFYFFGYQAVALVFGLALIFLLIRWTVKPYRRMVEAARGSPVRGRSSTSESEFVVETFRALVEQLQAKEKELAHLHELERTRAEKSERFSERLVASIPSGLVAIDSQGAVTSVNGHASEIFGGALAHLRAGRAQVGKAGFDQAGFDYRTFFGSAPTLVDMIGDCITRGTYFRREEVEIKLPDGTARCLGVSVSPIADATHRVEGALCLMTDLTEVVELRERMKLQDNLANLGEMAAGLAHEFKNSLATIQGYVQLIQDQAPLDAAAGARPVTLDAMLEEVRLLTGLVTDFLNFARPQQLAVSRVDLDAIIRQSADEVAPKLEAEGIELRVRSCQASLAGDESLLRRAVVNLLRNAAEAIEPNSLHKLIEVFGSVDPGPGPRHAHIRIRDTGSGISQSELARIFIPFFTTKARGYGIGLAIVQKIIVAHGGSVSVEKSDSSGTVFHCRLPLSPPPIMEGPAQDVI